MSALPQVRPVQLDASSEPQNSEARKMEIVGRLVSGVAHDFNNLLTGIVLCSDLLLANLEKESRLWHYAHEIRSAGSKGASLIQQLLSIARPHAAQSQPLSFNDVIDGIRMLLNRLIGENILLATELAEDLGLVRMDPTQAQQIVLNLVLNARDAMPDGGKVFLRTRNVEGTGRSATGEVELEVSDDGCGMDEQTRERVFEPFFTTKKTGNGLGLATIAEIVKQARGSITLDSAPGFGTRIFIQLPRLELIDGTKSSAETIGQIGSTSITNSDTQR